MMLNGHIIIIIIITIEIFVQFEKLIHHLSWYIKLPNTGGIALIHVCY